MDHREHAATARVTPAPRCLVVDDEDDTAAVLVYHLNRLGFATASVGSGEQAEAALKSGGWDLVVVDVLLPDSDGRDLLPLIRSLDEHPGVILTSVLDPIDLYDHTADALLSKPFRGVDVSAAVHLARQAA